MPGNVSTFMTVDLTRSTSDGFVFEVVLFMPTSNEPSNPYPHTWCVISHRFDLRSEIFVLISVITHALC